MAQATDLDGGIVGDRIVRTESEAYLVLSGVTTLLPATDDSMELPAGTTLTLTSPASLGESILVRTSVVVTRLGDDTGLAEQPQTFVSKTAANVTAVLSGLVSFRNAFKR